MEVRDGIEPPMRVLQTLALPLGYRTFVLFGVLFGLNGLLPYFSVQDDGLSNLL